MRYNKQAHASHYLLRFVIFAILLIFLSNIMQSSAQNSGDTLSVAMTKSGIPTLVGTNGHTLYTFSRDSNGVSACDGDCATIWPPFTVGQNDMLAFDSAQVVGTVATIQRSDGSTQLTYNGWPLYYYSEDTQAGDDLGNGVRDLWFAANPAELMLSSDGLHLVGAGGMTLYVFTEDNGNESFCLDECANEWHPLIAQQGITARLGAGLTGTLDAFQRSDGVFQLSYNGWPLYFFSEDEAPGDMNGDGMKELWFAADMNLEQLEIVVPASTPGAATAFPTALPTVAATANPTDEGTAEVTPETTAEITPETTSEATSEPSSEFTPEVTPEQTTSP